MDQKLFSGLGILLVIIFIFGCSGSTNSSNPAIPEIETQALEVSHENSGTSSHIPLGFSVIEIDATDPDDVIAEMIPVRAGSIHLNILKLLEYGPCYDCFSIVGAYMVEPGVLNVDIQITHPFDNLDFSIFDVRGIIMFEGEHDFNGLDRYISDPALGDGELVNAEGFTSLYNCLTYGWAGELVTYCPGILSTPSMPEADCNGFLRHITNNPANTRNAFYAGDSVMRTYTLRMPTTEFKLGYAVDANWAVPISSPVDDPITDFGINANCQEPWKIEVNCPPIPVG